jgi:L-threonylcarbamoyladenylate synthase
LAADAFNIRAVERIFEIKRRRPDNPLLVLIKSREAVPMLAEEIPPAAACLMDSFWPGKITIILPAGPPIHETLTGGTGRIGIRVPGHPVAAALVKAVDTPITGTSANVSGKGGCSTLSDLDPEIEKASDLVLDAGALTPGKGSTVVDVRKNGVCILREGAISRTDLLTVLQRNGLKMIDNSE